MTPSEVEKEFQIRRYRWEISEFEREIAEGFPNLRAFPRGYAFGVYELMQKLNEGEQLILAHAILKHFHPQAAEHLSEKLSAQDQILLNKAHVQASNLDAKFEFEIARRKEAGEKVSFASKRKLQKAMITKFRERFGPQFTEMDTGREISTEVDSFFKMKHAGWVISTWFRFGRQEAMIECRHTIDSETSIPLPKHPEILVPAFRLGWHMPWLCVYRWTHLAEAQIDPVCETAVRTCGYFYKAVPKLLEGLDPNKITRESR